MRILLVAVLATAIAGCTGSSGVDVLKIEPSSEITSSIGGRPVPSAPIGGDDRLVGTQRQGVIAAQVAFAPPEASISRSKSKQPKVYRQRFGDAKPVRFKGGAPHPFQIHGVDVSRWQDDINWHVLRRQGANFAYIKATEGGDHLDPMFKRNWNAAANAGIPRGAYHFFYWCRPGHEQSAWFIRNVPKAKGALPPVLDVEWNSYSRSCPKRPSRAVVLKKMQVFLDDLEQHYGQKPVIYTTPDFYRDNLRGQFTGHSFWLRSVKAHPSELYPGRKWAFWQYSGTGLSKGVEGHIDLNVFNGTEQGWHDWLSRRTH